MSEIDKIDALFKAAGFIFVKLIPGGVQEKEDAYKFDWKLEEYTAEAINI